MISLKCDAPLQPGLSHRHDISTSTNDEINSNISTALMARSSCYENSLIPWLPIYLTRSRD